MKFAITLDIGGTNVKYALIDQRGRIVYESLKSTNGEGSNLSFLERLKSIIREVIDYAESHNLEISGIGIGVPSVVDDGTVLFANNLLELNNQNLCVLLSEFNIPVFVENDANMMGLGEVAYGSSKGLSDVVFLTIGTGIGGALFLNGELYGGYHNRGTELGHIIIHGTNGNSCTCGASGCLEAHASTNALIHFYRRLMDKRGKSISNSINGKYITERYEAQEEEAILATNDHFDNLALGVASLINVFAPQKLIIGGGISESGDFYIRNIRERVEKLVMKETSLFTTIDVASLGNKAGCLGAAALVFRSQKLFMESDNLFE